MKAKMKALAVAVALAASGMANAAIDTGAGGNGELFLSVWDSTLGNEASFNIGLNININSFNGNGSYSGGILSNIFSDPVFTANFDAANFTTQSNWKWNVVASINNVSDGNSVMSTSVSTPVVINNNAATNGAANTFNYQSNLGSCDSCGTNGNINALTYAGSSSWGSDLGGAAPINNAGSLGSALYFFKATDNQAATDYTTDSGSDATMVNYAYTWTLDSTGNLNYNAVAAPVPVPAAVWLLGSALVGLVGVARRRETMTA